MQTRHRSVHDVRGFTLLELMLVVAVVAIVGAMAVPAMTNTTAQMRLSSAAREVERELQTARLRAVGADRVIRVRFNCPGARQYRMVEVLGSPAVPAANDADGQAATRCGYAGYPFPDNDRDFFAIPNHDGPIRELPQGVSFGAVQAVEFWPDGTAHASNGSPGLWPVIGLGGTSLVVTGSVPGGSPLVKTITVNGVGKVTLQ